MDSSHDYKRIQHVDTTITLFMDHSARGDVWGWSGTRTNPPVDFLPRGIFHVAAARQASPPFFLACRRRDADHSIQRNVRSVLFRLHGPSARPRISVRLFGRRTLIAKEYIVTRAFAEEGLQCSRDYILFLRQCSSRPRSSIEFAKARAESPG